MATEEQFTKLIQENSGIIHKVILLYVDDNEERSDLYQEVLLQAWKSFGKFRGDSKFSTWLYRVSLNTVFTFNRKESRKPETSSFDEIKYKTEHKEVEQKSDQKNHLLFLIKKLDEIDRMIISLHLDGYSNKEIAEITGLTANNAGVKLHRIKERLIAQMKQEN
ncbi:MAG: RNA polymerase sigma factor [Balneolaceae bacterium]